MVAPRNPTHATFPFTEAVYLVIPAVDNAPSAIPLEWLWQELLLMMAGYYKGSWIVQNRDDMSAVALNPEYCQCLAVRTCYHILAVKIPTGFPVQAPKKIISLTQLYVRKRKNTDRTKSGRNFLHRKTMLLADFSSDIDIATQISRLMEYDE